MRSCKDPRPTCSDRNGLASRKQKDETDEGNRDKKSFGESRDVPTATKADGGKPRRLGHLALLKTIVRWFDSSVSLNRPEDGNAKRIDWVRCLPFFAMHLACLAVFWVGWSWTAVVVALALYWLRMFAITGFYHRYFSHRTFKTSRPAQFIFAFLGASAVQRGPLWWAAHHRRHHQHSDGPQDPHSPGEHGLFWSHMGWITSPANFRTDFKAIPDLARYRELRFLDRYDILVPALLGVGLFLSGSFLGYWAPGLNTSGPQMLVWGLFLSTIVLFHATCLINSAAHKFGRKRYPTSDESRNSFFLALITLGEGWHNNHHHYPASVRQGFFWWEIDITYYLLRALAGTGLIWDLRPVPARVKRGGTAGGRAGNSRS